MPGKPTRTTKTRKAKEKRIEHEREAERYLFSWNRTRKGGRKVLVLLYYCYLHMYGV